MVRPKSARQVAHGYAHAMLDMSERLISEAMCAQREQQEMSVLTEQQQKWLTKAGRYVLSAILHAQTDQQKEAAKKQAARLIGLGVDVPHLSDPKYLLRDELSLEEMREDLEALLDKLPQRASSLRAFRRLCAELCFEDLRKEVGRRIDALIAPITISDGRDIEPALPPPRKDTWV